MTASSKRDDLLKSHTAALWKALSKKMSVSKLYHLLHLPSNANSTLRSNKRLVKFSTLLVREFTEPAQGLQGSDPPWRAPWSRFERCRRW